MDPDTLSMEQGKQILRKFGIPQKDIDLMTEKWVVVASVEVLLRFPLMPGEDPTARCVSTTSHPAKLQPSTISQAHGDREKRKSNTQLMSKTDRKPKVMKQIPDPSVRPPPQRPIVDKTLKEQPWGAVRSRAPTLEEEEAMVKCKNCGAFGHNAKSRQCPMKCWHQALPVQPLGADKEKNQKPRKPSQIQAPGLYSKTDSEKEESQRPEEQLKTALPQISPRSFQEQGLSCGKQSTGSCAFLRKPTRPLPVQVTRKRSSLVPVLTAPSPVETAEMGPAFPSCSYNKRSELRPSGPVKRHGMDFPDGVKTDLRNCQGSGTSSKQITTRSGVSSKSVLQSAMRTPALGHSFKPQEHIQCPDVDSKSTAPAKPKCDQDLKIRVQAPGKNHIKVPTQACQSQSKKPRLSAFQSPQMITQLPDVGALNISRSTISTCAPGLQHAPTVITNTPALKTRVCGQTPYCSPCVSSVQVSAASQSSHATGNPNISGSVRWDTSLQSSRISVDPISKSPTKNTHLACQSSLDLKDSERVGLQAPRSVLYEDLMVSSSSEDSDWD